MTPHDPGFIKEVTHTATIPAPVHEGSNGIWAKCERLCQTTKAEKAGTKKP